MSEGNVGEPKGTNGWVGEADWTDFSHTGPGTLAGTYLRQFWQPVSLAEDIDAGRARPIRIMSEDFTLYRGQSGAAHLLAFRCAHRGTQLSTGWVEGDDLRCFYHGWKYGPGGQCVEQPAEPEPFCHRIRIRIYPLREYLGLVFAFLGSGEPPPFPRFPELEREGVPGVRSYARECNYFNNIENGADPAHVPFVHRVSGLGSREVPLMLAEESPFGITMRDTKPDGAARVNQFGMPNILVIKLAAGRQLGWLDEVSWRVPVDDERHNSFNISLLPATGAAADAYRERLQVQRQTVGYGAKAIDQTRRVIAGETRIDEIEDRSQIVNVEDSVAQLGQGRIADRTKEHLGRSDVVVSLLRRIWARELRALAEGRPPSQWSRPPALWASADDALLG